MVTKFVQGGDLGNYIHNIEGALSEDLVRNLALQVALGIQGLHQRNIMHRDIKPDNLLVSDASASPKVFIADFGAAVQLESPSGKATFRIGTAGYTAPELIQGQPYGLKIDVWSLGCLIYSMLCGQVPFWSKDK